jgi:hypothetical protein
LRIVKVSATAIVGKIVATEHLCKMQLHRLSSLVVPQVHLLSFDWISAIYWLLAFGIASETISLPISS